jgi:hypothetical protein
MLGPLSRGIKRWIEVVNVLMLRGPQSIARRLLNRMSIGGSGTRHFSVESVKAKHFFFCDEKNRWGLELKISKASGIRRKPINSNTEEIFAPKWWGIFIPTFQLQFQCQLNEKCKTNTLRSIAWTSELIHWIPVLSDVCGRHPVSFFYEPSFIPI